MFGIGVVAELAQVSVRTLRYYDEEGLLRPSWVDPDTGYRWYSAQRQGWPRLQHVLEQKEHKFAAPSIAQEIGSNPILMTLALPVQETVEIHLDDISTRELPGLSRAACTVIHGDPNYDEAFGAIFKWIEESGRRPGNEQREVYLDCDGPRNTWVLELQVALLPKEP